MHIHARALMHSTQKHKRTCSAVALCWFSFATRDTLFVPVLFSEIMQLNCPRTKYTWPSKAFVSKNKRKYRIRASWERLLLIIRLVIDLNKKWKYIIVADNFIIWFYCLCIRHAQCPSLIGLLSLVVIRHAGEVVKVSVSFCIYFEWSDCIAETVIYCIHRIDVNHFI